METSPGWPAAIPHHNLRLIRNFFDSTWSMQIPHFDDPEASS
jgi:hypothetical protein